MQTVLMSYDRYILTLISDGLYWVGRLGEPVTEDDLAFGFDA